MYVHAEKKTLLYIQYVYAPWCWRIEGALALRSRWSRGQILPRIRVRWLPCRHRRVSQSSSARSAEEGRSPRRLSVAWSLGSLGSLPWQSCDYSMTEEACCNMQKGSDVIRKQSCYDYTLYIIYDLLKVIGIFWLNVAIAIENPSFHRFFAFYIFNN